eukprot:1166698-Amorphochlora_amoeboformis.AAC.2
MFGKKKKATAEYVVSQLTENQRMQIMKKAMSGVNPTAPDEQMACCDTSSPLSMEESIILLRIVSKDTPLR